MSAARGSEKVFAGPGRNSCRVARSSKACRRCRCRYHLENLARPRWVAAGEADARWIAAPWVLDAFWWVLPFPAWLDSHWNATAAGSPGGCCPAARWPRWCLADAGCACVAEMAVISHVAFLPASLPSGRIGHMQWCAPRHCWLHASLLTAAARTHANVFVFSHGRMAHSSIRNSLLAFVPVFSDGTMAHQHSEFVARQRASRVCRHDGASAFACQAPLRVFFFWRHDDAC